MSTASTVPAPAPAGAQSGQAKATPWLGIVAVLLGVMTSVMVGQLLSVGLPDLRGALHLSVDQGAWLAPVYNAGQMLTGPLTVYLGGMIGPRRVLLTAVPIAFVCALIAPWVNSYASLLAVLTLLGFACGSFYPLTLSFVARNLPPKLILFGISAYVFDVIGSLHVSTLIEGFAMQYLSWRWLFWASLLLTGPMGYFVYRGMPDGPTAAISPADKDRLRPTWSGFLYTSLGLATLFLLLTQGDRLDWWRSGTIVALLVCGAFLLLAGWVRHLLRPNPMVQLGAIFDRNVLLLSLCLCVLRFSLLSSAVLVPQFLGGVRGLLPLQSGVVLAWVALPTLVCALAAALSLIRLDPRLVLAGGFGTVCLSCYAGMQLASVWSRGNFVVGQLLLALGTAAAVCGLVGSIVLELINSGAAKDPIRTLTFVAWFHTVRLFGGQIMTTLLTHLITIRGRFHTSMLAQDLAAGSFTVNQQLQAAGRALASAGSSPSQAAAGAAALIAGRLRAQAATLSLADAYTVEAIVLASSLILVASIRRAPMQLRDLARRGKQHA